MLSSAFSGSFLAFGALDRDNRTTRKYFDCYLVIDRRTHLFTNPAPDAFHLIHNRIGIFKVHYRESLDRTLGNTEPASLIGGAGCLIDDREAHANFGALPQRNKCVGRAGRDTWKVGRQSPQRVHRSRNRISSTAPGGRSQSVLNFSGGAGTGTFSPSFCCS